MSVSDSVYEGKALDHFLYRDGQLFAEDVPVAQIAAAVGTPFYVYSTATLTRHFYQHAEPNQLIAVLAPRLLTLAADGDVEARRIVADSAGELVSLALRVVTRLFPGVTPSTLGAGISGPILTHAALTSFWGAGCPLRVTPVTGAPIEGVRRLVARAV